MSARTIAGNEELVSENSIFVQVLRIAVFGTIFFCFKKNKTTVSGYDDKMRRAGL